MRMSSTYILIIVGVTVAGGLGAVTPPGKIITAAVLRFLLYYAGVLALIAMTTAVGIGLVATDRIIMGPGQRVIAQAVHRAVALSALVFLIIHIVLEILAARSSVADSVIPFLSQFRTFYIGVGTIASDLIILLVVTGFMRPRFSAFQRTWAWRAIHVSAYVSWIFSIIHGLLGGRAAKPYVDWSYGGCVAAVALALAIRFVATTRSREEVALSAMAPAADRPGSGAWPALPPGLPQAAAAQTGQLALPAGPSAARAVGPTAAEAEAAWRPVGSTGPNRRAAGTGPIMRGDEPWDNRPLAATTRMTRPDPADTEPAWDSREMAALRDVEITQPNSWQGGGRRRRPEPLPDWEEPARDDDEPWDGVIRPAQSVSWDELRPADDDLDLEPEPEPDPEPQFVPGGLLAGGGMAYPTAQMRRDPRAADTYGGLMR
jgi:hypothetical protein